MPRDPPSDPDPRNLYLPPPPTPTARPCYVAHSIMRTFWLEQNKRWLTTLGVRFYLSANLLNWIKIWHRVCIRGVFYQTKISVTLTLTQLLRGVSMKPWTISFVSFLASKLDFWIVLSTPAFRVCPWQWNT